MGFCGRCEGDLAAAQHGVTLVEQGDRLRAAHERPLYFYSLLHGREELFYFLAGRRSPGVALGAFAFWPPVQRVAAEGTLRIRSGHCRSPSCWLGSSQRRSVPALLNGARSA